MPEVLMPRLSDTMEEGTVSRWLKSPGDSVARGDVLAEIETDKATTELEAFDDGVLQSILVPEGSTVAIGQPVAVIGNGARGGGGNVGTRDDHDETGRPPSQASPHGPGASAAQDAPPVRPGPAPADGHARRVRVLRSSPLARTLAGRHGLDLADIEGSGPGGRVVRADVEAAIASQEVEIRAGARPATRSEWAEPTEAEERPLNNLRRVTARRLSESAAVPHFFVTNVVDAGRLLALRAEVNDSLADPASKVTVTDLLVKACAKALLAHPDVNSSWGGDVLLRHHQINIGVAVATPAGLLVPVLRGADRLNVQEIAATSRALAEKAREQKLSLEEMSGGTFTLSNLGMHGVDSFTAIINPPEAAILAVGAATPEAVVRGGEVVAATIMRMTLTVDHRVLDGAGAAVFMSDLRDLLQSPIGILL